MKISVWICFLLAGIAQAQLSTSAYRALGQADLRQNGTNQVQGVEMYSPYGVALDNRDGGLHLYVADSHNSRVLAWQDVTSYQTGNPPALVLGQPSPLYSSPYGIGVQGFNAPASLAVNPTNGDLYVADFGDNRILQFPSPFENSSNVQPGAVFGQPSFNVRTANSGGIGKNSLNGPRGVAFDSTGNLWVADSGNSRVLRFNAAVLSGSNPQADLVIGQKDFVSGSANQGGPVSASGFDTPFDLTFDQQGNLYVADFNNTRVLKFAAPLAMSMAATAVFGEANFTARGVPATPSQSTMAGPSGLTVDSSGNLYVAVPLDNRIMVFAAGAPTTSGAKAVLGQTDFVSNLPNPATYPLASASSFSGPTDVKADAAGNLYVADSGDNRVMGFPANSKIASQVWGQLNFSANGINQIKPGSLNAPYKIAIDYTQSPFALYVSDVNNHRVLVWNDATAFLTGNPANGVIGQPDLVTAQPNVDTHGSAKPSATSLNGPKGMALDGQGNLYLADSGNNRVLRYPRPVNQQGRIAPDIVIGQADFASADSSAVTSASLHGPSAVAIGPDGDVFVADSGNNRVLEFSSAVGIHAAAIRVYGQPSFTSSAAASPASAQSLQVPQGILVDASFTLYVADAGNNRVLIFSDTTAAPPTGAAASIVIGQGTFISVAAGGGPAGLESPTDVALDSQGDIFVSDTGNSRVLIFPSLFLLPSSGGPAMQAIGQRDLNGNSPNWNTPDSFATPEGMYFPFGIYVDRRDTLYVADSGNSRVTQFLKLATVTHLANSAPGAPVAQGGLISLTGSGLSDTQASAPGTPLPFSLADRQVSINDQLMTPLSSVAPAQISLQIPWETPLGTPRIAVRVADTNELIAGGTFVVAAASPELFPGGAASGLPTIMNQDNSVNSSANPATRGSTISLFGTGQGPVSPSVADGTPGPDPPASTIANPTTDGATCLNQQPAVCVAIGTAFGSVQFSGLAPGMVGVWQITVQIPQTAPTGAVNTRAVILGTPSNIVVVAIK